MENTIIQMFKSTVQYDDEYIWLKPVCDFFKINYENQTRKIKSDRILANHSTKKSNRLMFGDNYPRILVDKIGFIRWIQLINPNTIDNSMQQKFEAYQELIFEFLYGNLEQEKNAKIRYQRLSKLKRLKEKINSEIKKEERLLNGYFDEMMQMQIPYKSQN